MTTHRIILHAAACVALGIAGTLGVQHGATLAPVDHEVQASGVQRSSKWPAVRKAFLETHGSCAACGTDKDLEVHHEKSFATHPSLELEPSNFIVLCRHGPHACHFRIGHGLRWDGGGNPDVRKDATESLKKVKAAHAGIWLKE